MADLSTVVKILFSGNDQASQVARAVGQSLSDLSTAAESIATPFAGIASAIEGIDAAAVGLAVVLGTLSVREATKFQSSLLDLEKQMDANEGSAQAQSAALEAIAQKYGVNANELVRSAADFKAAGYDMDTSVKLVTQSLNLMIAGGVKTVDAVSVMNRALAGFQIPAAQVVDEAQHIGDVLNRAADITKSSFTELATGFADLSPIAKQSGLSFEETAAILTEVIDVFGSGSEAANALKSGFLSLVDPSRESRVEMERLGVSITGSNGQLKSVKEILSELAPAFNKLTDAQQLQASSILFGKEQAGKFVQVLGTYGDAMDRARILTETAGGSIDKEVTIRLQSAEVQFNRTVEAIRQFETHLGNQFLDATVGASSGVTAFANALTKVADSGALSPLVTLITDQAGHIEGVLRAIAVNLPDAFALVDFSGLVDSIKGLGDEFDNLFTAIFGEIDLTTVEGLASALQTIVNTGESIVLTTQGITKAFQPFGAALGESVRHMNDLDKSSKIDFGEFIGSMQAIVNAGALVAGAIITIGKSGVEMKTVFDVIFGALTVGINALQVAFDTVSLTVIETARNIADAALAVAEATGADTVARNIRAALGDLTAYSAAISDNLRRNADEMAVGWDQMTGKTTEASKKTDELRARLEAFSTTTRENAAAIETNNEATRQTVKNYDGILAVLNRVESDSRSATTAISSLGDAQKNIVLKGDSSFDNTPIQGLIKTWKDGVPTFTAAADAHIKATDAFKQSGDAAKTNADKVSEMTKKSDDFLVKMEQIASNERIKTIEAHVQLNVAELEAQTKQVEAAFKSIDTTIGSTGDLLGSLFGDLSKADSYTKLDIKSQIDLENQRRQKALDLQAKLTEAEIDKINAQTDALSRGDALIKIDGNGLAPQLEAFMWEILKAIKTRANAEFQSYLLGVGA